jgi:hypothetical protein
LRALEVLAAGLAGPLALWQVFVLFSDPVIVRLAVLGLAGPVTPRRVAGWLADSTALRLAKLGLCGRCDQWQAAGWLADSITLHLARLGLSGRCDQWQAGCAGRPGARRDFVPRDGGKSLATGGQGRRIGLEPCRLLPLGGIESGSRVNALGQPGVAVAIGCRHGARTPIGDHDRWGWHAGGRGLAGGRPDRNVQPIRTKPERINRHLGRRTAYRGWA